ncbi:LysE family translocator [Mangrovitalea sediminis]|uniref:LysE family translocator n=1 Tax=Mangrovitalea sediminis TaxID=1982043 RepID=UPI000BE5CFDC|nr:LysE family translocator [Mangrovitalea sediminis]
MTADSFFSLFIALVILAVIPGPGVFSVVARSMTSGFRHGLATVFGIVFGDYIFIALSIYGLSALASTMGEFFVVIKILGATYLAYLGVRLFFKKAHINEVEPVAELSFFANFTAGLVTTLSNPKAILFYVSFFPAFINIQSVTHTQVIQILIIATIAVGSVMAAYAYAASKAGRLFNSSGSTKALNVTSGSILIGCGVFLVTKA